MGLSSLLTFHEGGKVYDSADLIADGEWGHMSGAGWWWMLVATLLWIGLIALVVWAFTRSSGTTSARPDPEAILAERFALGEISASEFAERRAALRKESVRGGKT